MRQKHETATSFSQLKQITQALMLKNGLLTNATHQESERTQEANNANAKAHTQERTQEARAITSANANNSEIESQSALKPKARVKKGALKPTKRAFSERQNTAFRDQSQARANSSRETKASHNANAFKTNQANNSSLRAKQGLATHQTNTRRQQ